jgi:antitoxin ParD1/3/4
MNVSLTPELEHWVDERVRSGRYASASEVIREALRLLEVQEAAKQRRLESVRQKIDRGLDQLQSGKGITPEDARSRIRAARGR